MSSRPLLEVAEPRRSLSSLYESIEAELALAERIFQKELGSRFPFVQQLVDHCADFQGKRLRPALVLLAGQACGSLSDDHAVLAAVVEMIHTATLVHDDILDEAVIRRHAATVNAEWGNETAVLLGDYLFTHAFHLAASLESTRACRAGSARSDEQGMRRVRCSRFTIAAISTSMKTTTFAIIRGKNGRLTAVSCRLGAWYAQVAVRGDRRGGFRSIRPQPGHYPFQIADDVLDIWGEERATGKSLGTDLEKQKLTLPIIRLLSLADPAAGATIRGLLREAKAEGRRRLRPYLEQTGSLEYAWQRAKQHVRLALDELDRLADSQATRALRTLAQFVMRRPS